jgi:hypothetical protein
MKGYTGDYLETNFFCYVGICVLDLLKDVVEIWVLLAKTVYDVADFLPDLEGFLALVGHE